MMSKKLGNIGPRTPNVVQTKMMFVINGTATFLNQILTTEIYLF